MALGLNSWGLTRDIMAEPVAMGGIALAPLGSYALWIHSQGFVQHVCGTSPGGVRSVDQFEDGARSVGMVLTPDMLPYIRLAGMESDTWLTGYLRSQDPAPHKSVQRRLSLTALQFKPELYGTTTLVNPHENSTNRKVEEHT